MGHYRIVNESINRFDPVLTFRNYYPGI